MQAAPIYLNRSRHRKKATPVTPYLIERIRKLSARDMFQDEIALAVGLSVSAVGRVQRRNGFPHMSRHDRRASR